MRKYWLASILLAAFCLLAACSGGEAEDTPAVNAAEAGGIELSEESEQLSLQAAGVVYSQIELNRLILSRAGQAEDAALTAINADLDAVAADYIGRLTQQEAPLFAADPTLRFSHQLAFSLYYADGDLVSVVFDCYQQTAGAAQPSVERYGYVYDALSGARLTLDALLGADYAESAVSGILRLINQAGEKEQYYPDLERLLLARLDPAGGWYADGEQVYIIYQPYTIAPGTLGLLEFPLAY